MKLAQNQKPLLGGRKFTEKLHKCSNRRSGVLGWGLGVDGGLRRKQEGDAQGRVDVLQAGSRQGETRARPRRGSTTASSHGRKQYQHRSLVKVSDRQSSDKLQCLFRNSGAGLAVSSAGNIPSPAHSILHAIVVVVHITAEATYCRRHNGCLTAGQADRYGDGGGTGHDTGRRG